MSNLWRVNEGVRKGQWLDRYRTMLFVTQLSPIAAPSAS